MQHLDEGTIHAWLDRALSPREGDDIARHVAECAACAERIARERGVIAGASRIVSALDVARGNVVPANGSAAPVSLWRRLHLTPARAALAASLLVAASAMFAVRHDTQGKMVLAPKAASQATPEISVSPSLSPPLPRPTVIPRPNHAVVSAPTGRVAKVKPIARDSLAANVATNNATVVAGTSAHESVPAPVASSVPASGLASAAMRTRALSFTNAASSSCYELVLDSASSFKRLPQRFALQRDEAGRNVVRAVTADGRIDSVLVGSEWVNRPPEFVVRFMAPEPVTLSFASNSARAQATSGVETRSVTVRRAECRP